MGKKRQILDPNRLPDPGVPRVTPPRKNVGGAKFTPPTPGDKGGEYRYLSAKGGNALLSAAKKKKNALSPGVPRTKPMKAPSMKASVVSPMTPGQKLASNVTNTTGNERDGEKYDVRTDAQGRRVHVYRDPKIKPVVIVPKKKKTW